MIGFKPNKETKKKAQESGFDGDFDDDEDDWPAFLEETLMVTYVCRRLLAAGVSMRWLNASVTCHMMTPKHGQGSMDEGDRFCGNGSCNDGTPRGTTQRP